MRESVGDLPLFTFSVGIAELSAGGDPQLALQAADRSMYSTKSGTRAPVTV
jgi:PleD family two-component response regulator